MRRTFLALAVLCLGVALGAASCSEDAGAKVQAGGEALSAAGAATGLAQLSLGGTVLSIAGALLAGKKAKTAAAFTESAWSREHLGELVDGLEAFPDQAARLAAIVAKAKA
jgi:hypothetical protein